MNETLSPQVRQLGRYSITRELRRERSSVVYLATDPVMHREVILKAVQLPPLKDATAHKDAELDPLEQAFARQAQAAGKLSHPHIVTVYEAGRVRDVGYLAIERINGRPLHELIASGWRPQFVHCASIAARIADAIEHAHGQDVMHGHLGPQHVLLQSDGVPKVEGFGGWIDGGSSSEDALHKTEKLLPYFQTGLTEEDRRRDVQAIASLLFMLLTGHAPSGKPVSLAQARSDVPTALARLVDGLLNAPSSGPRRSAGDVRDALTAFIWNERKENIAPATLGIPLAAPPRTDKDAVPPQQDLDATTGAKALGGRSTQRPVSTPSSGSSLSSSPNSPLSLPAADKAAPKTTTKPTATNKASAHAAANKTNALSLWFERNKTAALIGAAVLAVLLLTLWFSSRSAGPTEVAVDTAPADTTVSNAVTTPAVADGAVQLDISPWGEVFVDGRAIGVSPPLSELKLPAGKHTIEIRFGDKAAVSAQVDVDPARPKQIKHRFE